MIVDQYGGAVGRVPDDATAFGHRRSAYDVIVIAMWDDPAQEEAHVTWARGLWDALQPYAENAVYVNYLGPDDGEDRIREAYGDEHYARLKALKRVYDPANVFPNNQNISPDSPAKPGFDHRVARIEAFGDRHRAGRAWSAARRYRRRSEPRATRSPRRRAFGVYAVSAPDGIWSSRADIGADSGHHSAGRPRPAVTNRRALAAPSETA